MSVFPWYKHYPSRFLGGVGGLGPELIGCYIVILDLIYDRGSAVPFDPRKIGHVLGCSTKKTNSLVQALLKAGKLSLDDGHLSNPVAEEVIDKRLKWAKKLRESGSKGGKLRAEIERTLRKSSDLGQGRLKHRAHARTEISSESSLEGSALSPTGQAEQPDGKDGEANPLETTQSNSNSRRDTNAPPSASELLKGAALPISPALLKTKMVKP